MIPILYSSGSLTEGTVPQHNGVGPLTDCISCKVTEERNGSYELVMEYHQAGVHSLYIEPNAFIKAKPNPTDPAQLFRIYKVGKAMNGKFTVYAQHISYDLSGKLISPASAASLSAAIALLNTKAGNFTISTNKSSNAGFKVNVPSSVRSWFGGKQGSLLDIYGGEWYFNNYTAELKSSRGADNGVQIRYAKNLTELSQEISMENLCTGILPYYVDEDGNVIENITFPTGLHLDVPRDIAIDFSQDVVPDSDIHILTQLGILMSYYAQNHLLTSVFSSLTLDFVQLETYEDLISLCDTVHVYFQALGVDVAAKVVKTEWNVLLDRYEHITLGNIRSSIADTFAAVQKTANNAVQRDLMDNSIKKGTGNFGGYVVLHDGDGDGFPDELLVMDAATVDTATIVWRWNKNGLGFSTTGYSGTYFKAITLDGKLIATDELTLSDGSNNQVVIYYAANGGRVRVNTSNGDEVALLYANTTSGGTLRLSDTDENITISESGSTGNITCVSLTQTSSRKVKKSIQPIKDARKILKLEAVQFDYKDIARGKDKRGFIAEDVIEVLPNLVTKETEETPATLDYIQMIPYLQAVIKEQDERIKALEEKISQIGG